MVRKFITAHGKRNNNPGLKYSVSDVNFYMVIMKKDKSYTKILINLFDTFQRISSCKTAQQAKYLPIFLILFETNNNTKAPTGIYHLLFHSILQRKIYVAMISYTEYYVISSQYMIWFTASYGKLMSIEKLHTKH